MPGNLTSASWASVWDGTAQKIWCVVNLNDMDSVLRPQLVQENRHILAYLCSSLLLGGRTNRLTTIKSTAHIWLENVAFYTESNKSVVGLVPISHMDLFKHAPIHISPIRVYKKSLCSTLSPSNPSLYLPTTCRDIFLSLITLRSLRLQFMLCSSPLGEENYLWTFWLTLWPLEPTFWSLFQLVSIFWLALNFLLYLWPPQWSFFLIVVYSDWPWLSCCSLSHIWLFVTQWIACQLSLSFTISQSLHRLMSIELMMLSNHLILCCPLSSCPQTFPESRSFPAWLSWHSLNIQLCQRR